MKQATNLPADEKVSSMYSIAFLNNRTVKDSIDAMKSTILKNNNKYHFYQLDSMYNGKVFNKAFRVIKTKERDAVYADVHSSLRFMSTEKTMGTVNNRNVYYDLQFANNIFFDMARKTSTYLTKVTEYMKYLATITKDSDFAKYKHKTMMIDVSSWTDSKSLTATRQLDNPVYYLYYAMYKKPELFKDLDLDLILHTDSAFIRIIPSKVNEKSYNLLKTELGRLAQTIVIEDDAKMDAQFKREEIYDKVVKNFSETYNFTGDNDVEEKVKERITEIESEKEVEETSTGDLEDELSRKVVNDEKLMKDIYMMTQEKKTGKSTVSNKRDQELREKQKQLKIENMTLEDIELGRGSDYVLEKMDVSDKVATTNKNVQTIKYPSFEKTYNEKLMKKDTMSMLTFLNDKSIPVYIRNIEVEDTSTELNLKETYTVDLEDANRVRHRLKFDLPKFIDNKFMYLNGNKKIIVKQLFMKPIVKTGPDEVQFRTNYNTIYVTRYGQKVSAKIEKFKKGISNVKKGIVVKYGNNVAVNNDYKTTIEYDAISKDISYIRIKTVEFYFNQEDVKKLVSERDIKLKENELCIGFIDKKTPIKVDIDTQQIGNGDIIDYIMSVATEELHQEVSTASPGKKFMYTRAKVMNKHVPIVLLTGFLEGLSTVLRKAKIQHYFTDTRPKVGQDEGVVQFANGYLVYNKYPFENSLLMNAFADIPTRGFDYEDFDGKDAYLTIFDTLYGAKQIGNAFHNFLEFMIDPITKEVLEDLNYPTDFVTLVLLTNSLLADNSFIQENNMNLYRVRSNEMVNAHLYKALSTAYINYKNTANNNNPQKISIPQDYILKKLLTETIVEDYSILNPIVELEKSRAITPKGPSGMNLDQAYTQDKRSYDKTMMGMLAMSTSPDANCGIVRQLTLEPNIIGPRGYIEVKDDKLDELNDATLFSPAEMLSPLGASRDDSIRTAMATKQSKHIIPIEKSSPVLISNGAEQVIHYHLSNDFSVVAKEDGKVVEIDDETGLIIVEYKDGTHQAIDKNPKVVKNGAGGFYLSNQLSCKLKVGQTFKKNDVIAADGKFFTESPLDGNRFNIGSLQKVACMGGYATYEDSTFITQKLSRDMASDIVMQKPITLGKNSNVDYMVKVGDHVQVGDELIRFETSFEDDSLNKFLDSIGTELQEEIKSLGKTPVKSKYAGVIEDIKVYSTVDLEELSPSLRKIVSGYYAKINKKKKQINKYDSSKSPHKLDILINEPTDKIETKDGKVKGTEVGEGVLIEIYIKYTDIMGVGDGVVSLHGDM